MTPTKATGSNSIDQLEKLSIKNCFKSNRSGCAIGSIGQMTTYHQQ